MFIHCYHENINTLSFEAWNTGSISGDTGMLGNFIFNNPIKNKPTEYH